MAEKPPPSIVVVGSGLAGFGVLRELRRLETLVTTPAEKMIANLKLDARIGRQAEAIDRTGKALLTTGGPIPYDSLVMATGASPFRPPVGGDAAHRAISINQLDHYARFRDELPAGARVLIMGAGLVGTEFANDLVTSGYKPVVVDMLPLPLAQLVPPAVGEKVRAALEASGVEWRLGRKVETIDYRQTSPGYVAKLDDGTLIEADTVLSAVGLRPNVALAEEAGLDVGLGIKVNEFGQTSDPDIYAIGDCAEYRHGLSAYVTPIMAAARAIAPTALGNPTQIRFPPLSVQVKTTLFPINLLPPRRELPGEWRAIESDDVGDKHIFVGSDDIVLGYVLTLGKCEERMEMDKMVGEAA